MALPCAVLSLRAPPALSIRLPLPAAVGMSRDVSAAALDVPDVLPGIGSAGSLPAAGGEGSFTWADARAGVVGGTPSAFLRVCSPSLNV